jgi:DNA-binding phage protein
MGLTRPFIESVKELADADPEFRVALLTEAAECFLNGELSVAKSMLRDYVKATIGFESLAREVEKSPESLMRMLSEKGNPRAENLSQLVAALRRHEGVTLHVEAAR